MVEIAIDNDRLFKQKRSRGKPSQKENHNLRRVREYLLLANQIRAYLQIIRGKKEVGNRELAEEIVARKRDADRRGLACQIPARLKVEHYRQTERLLNRYHDLHQEVFGNGKRRPSRSLTGNSPLNVPCSRGTSAYPWQLSATEMKGVEGWREEFQQVKMKWLPVGNE
ncbi:MAG: hypothetical protein RIC18_05490 [Hoeflea sp.]|uniref:hypothetical protein n=1 Tax=Hoeflea sp. TaxID=1940281 RepID=UPI0032EBE0A3